MVPWTVPGNGPQTLGEERPGVQVKEGESAFSEQVDKAGQKLRNSGAAWILHLGASSRISTMDGESLKSCSLSLGLSSPMSVSVDIDTRCGEDLHPPSHPHPSLPHLALLSAPFLAQRPFPGGHCLAGLDLGPFHPPLYTHSSQAGLVPPASWESNLNPP